LDLSGERIRGFLLFGLIVAALAAVVLIEWRRPRSEPIRLDAPSPPPSVQATAAPSPTPRPIQVYVSGAVSLPDVYALPHGSIVKDALEAAGGAGGDADLDRINLAAALADGQHVYVPRQGEESPPIQAPVGGSSSQGEGAVNINTADAAELETLPGIGPSLAGRIIAYREANGPFASVDEITQVSGIGPATLEEIRELITTE
jgi:competence protein ComEA